MKVSIITAAFNSRVTIEKTVSSVLSQNCGDIEYIVIDGASADGTLDLLNPFKDRIHKIISERDGGMYYALNKGIGLATGDIVGFLHADDTYTGAGVLGEVAKVFAATGADAVYGDLAYVTAAGTLVRDWRAGDYDRDAFRRGWMPPHPAVFIKRELYTKLGGFDTSFRIAADYELLVRFMYSNAVKVAYLPQCLVNMRIGGLSNRSLGNILRKSAEDYRVIKRYGLGGALTLLRKNISKLPQFLPK